MVIKERTLSYIHEDRRPGNVFSFELNPDKRPKQIDTFSSVNKVRNEGIYTLDGDALKLCCIWLDTEKRPRPDEFRTRAGSNLILMTFKKK